MGVEDDEGKLEDEDADLLEEEDGFGLMRAIRKLVKSRIVIRSG